jgi:DNA-binding MarR family transcriptional regulator
MTAEEKRELAKKILGMQRRIMRCSGDDEPHVWLELNLTIAQVKTLFFINFEGVTNFKRVAEALGVTPPNVTGIIDRLVEQKLVKREENPQNRRMQLLSLTETGKNLLTELKERNTAHMSGILESLSQEDLSCLAQGMSALSKAVENNYQKQLKLRTEKNNQTTPD